MPYVCAFRGRRDYYQLPIALEEGGLLDQFVTDAYYEQPLRRFDRVLPELLGSKLRFRFDAAIPDEKISCLWASAVRECASNALNRPRWRTYARVDADISRAAAERARCAQADLLLYTPYAWEAFTASYRHSPKRILFQFHPHPEFEREILAKDAAMYPIFSYSYEEEAGADAPAEIKRRNRDPWRYADLILCASTFTKNSLVAAGADSEKCVIVPYGIDIVGPLTIGPSLDSFRPVYVGSGTQRKGLHLLLMAWGAARLPPDSLLTVVCRSIDPGVEDIALNTPRVRLLRGVSGPKLRDLYRSSSLFAMPSLVEGFGQVYLEALAEGCPVLGTANTCLPDLEGSSRVVFEVEPHSVDDLVATLETLSRELPGDKGRREEARTCAAQWTWARFRQGVRLALP